MVGILLTIGCMVIAADPSPPPAAEPPAEVRRLVRQLDTPRLDDRNAAESKLIDLGPNILPLLPSSDSDLSAEVRQRLARVRQQLQQKVAAAAVKSSSITLKKKDIRLSQLIEEFQTQTGNHIVDVRAESGEAPDDPELSVDFDKTPFWEAMTQVLKKTGLAIYPFESEQAIRLVARRSGAIVASEKNYPAGPFLFVPVDFTARRMFDNADDGSLRLGLLVAWEPRLSPIGLTQKLTEIQALDENGEAVDVDVRAGQLDVPVNPKATCVKLGIPFALPSRDVHKISRLTGTLDVLVPGPVETFRFGGLPGAKEVKKRVASATVTLSGMRKNNDTWEVEVRVRFDDAGDALASHRGWIFANEAYLEGPDGKRVDNEGFETKMQTEDEVGVAYFFYLDAPPDKYSFVYKTPAKIFSSRFKYEFDDLELP
jgi:hypothetical protein